MKQINVLGIRGLKLFLLILVFAKCSSPNNNIIELSNIPDGQGVDVSFEINGLEIIGDEELFIAKSIENPNFEFIMQTAPSILSTVDSSIDYYFSTVFDSDFPEGKYQLSPYKMKPRLELKENDNGQLTVFENGKPALTYNYGMQLGKDVEERYRRSSYIHPIYDLQGNILTDDFPADHFHHRGLSWMWPKIFIDSVRYDSWHIYGQQGDLEGLHQVFEKWIIKEVGPICATFGVKNYWQLDNGRKVMDEWVYVKVYKSSGVARAIDVKLKFKANSSIELEGQTKKGYGGLNLRFAPREETQITSQDGREDDSDLKSLPWADQSAKFANNDYFSGASIFQRPTNNNYPAGWCLRHYGFLGVAWPGVETYSMKQGDELTLSFRLWIHMGDSDQGRVENAFKVFSNPPIIKYE